MKVESEVLETIERLNDEGKPDNITFKASELYNLVQDSEGTLTGFPTAEGSNLQKFIRDLGIKNSEKIESLKELIDLIVDKKVLIKAYDKENQGKTRTYLKFRY